MSIYKAYDIRGTYPDQIDEAVARRIGAAFARFLGAGKLVVGRDMRTMAPSVQEAGTTEITFPGRGVSSASRGGP